MPRPTKFSKPLALRIVEALRKGNTRTAAAFAVGIDYSTLRSWVDRYPEFSLALERAEAEAEIDVVAILMGAALSGDVKAAQWWLERRRSSDWRQVEQVDLQLYIRERAAELGLDVDAAVAEAMRIVGMQR